MTSIFTNTQSKVIIHILHDDTLTQDNRQKFIRTAEKYSQGLELHDVTEYRKRLSGKLEMVAEKWTVGTLFRLFVPEILMMDKLIYLDCDVLVNLDVKDLWDIDLEGKSLAAVRDEACYALKPLSFRNIELRLTGCRRDEYVNAGVAVMNLAKFRERGKFFDIASQWLISHSNLPIYPDQDALNAIFLGDIKFIDDKFNTDIPSQDISGRIIHMWRSKPWRRISRTPTHMLYWDMFISSAWGENITCNELARIFMNIADITSHNIHMRGKHCFKPAARAIFKKLILSDLRRNARMIFRHIYSRLTRKNKA